MQSNRKLRLWVFQRNVAAIAFYERAGFESGASDGRFGKRRTGTGRALRVGRPRRLTRTAERDPCSRALLRAFQRGRSRR